MKMLSHILATLTIAECAPPDHTSHQYGLQGAVYDSLEADDRCAAEDVQCGLSLLQTRVRTQHKGRNADKLGRVLSEAQTESGENSAINLGTGLEGDSILEASMTPAEAKLICAELPGCKGFTFQYSADQDGPVLIHFRSRVDASDPSLTTVTMDSHAGSASEGSELAKKLKEEPSSIQLPAPDVEDTLAKADSHEEYSFEAVDGGDGRACRGLSGTDHSEMYYSLESASTLSTCKDLCVKTAGCVGVSFGDDSKRCEVWNKPAYIGMSVPSEGSQCHRFLGRNSRWDGRSAAADPEPAKATSDPMSDMHDITEKLKQLTAPEKKNDELGSGLFNKIEKLGAKVLDPDSKADGSDETIEMMHQMHEAAKTLEKFETKTGKKVQMKSEKAHRHKKGDKVLVKATDHKKTKDQSHKIDLAKQKAADHSPTDQEQGEFSELGTSIVEQIAKLGSKIFALEEGMKHSQSADATDATTGTTSGEASFSEHDAYVFVGGDLAVETVTLQQAKAKCSALAGCVGFSFKGTSTDQGPVQMTFKSTWQSAGLGWTSFHLKAHKAEKESIQKALMVIETATNNTEDAQVTNDQQVDYSAVTPGSNLVSVSQTAMYDFQAVDGGVDRACRGLSSTDSFAWYYELASADSLQGCKDLCVNAGVCKGIEYNSDIGVCELWTREQGIGTSTAASGYECHRLVTVERSSKASSKASLIQMGEVTRNDTTNAVETAWMELKKAHLGFDAVDGGVGRACRGSSEVDNSTEYFAVENAASLDGCKLLCVKADGCVGISFHLPTSRCEIWNRPQGVGSSTPAENSECHRFLGLGATLTEHKSYTFAGYDLLIESMTLEEAKTKCAVLPGCKGFTSQEVPQGGAVEVHFKSKWETSGQGWTSFHLEAPAPVAKIDSPIKESSLDSAQQVADAPADDSSQIAQMGSDLLNQIAKLGNQMVATHEDSSSELSMDDVQKMINDAVDRSKKGQDIGSHEDFPKPAKASSEKLTMQDVQKMINDAVQQKQRKLHKEQKPRSAEGKKTIENMNGQMDELKDAVAVAKDAVKSVSQVKRMPKKKQSVWADKMRESAEDLKIVEAPLTHQRWVRRKAVREEQLLRAGHKQQSKARQQRDHAVQQQQHSNSKRLQEQNQLQDHWQHQEHDREEREVLKKSEEVRSKRGETKHTEKKQEMHAIPQQPQQERMQSDEQKLHQHQNRQLSEQHRIGQKETQQAQRVQKVQQVQQAEETQQVQHHHKQQQQQQKQQQKQEQQQAQQQQAQQEQTLQQAQQAQQVKQARGALKAQQAQQQQVQQEQDQLAQQAQQTQQVQAQQVQQAQHAQHAQQAQQSQEQQAEQLRIEKQRQKQDSWFKKHLLPKPKAIKEMTDRQNQEASQGGAKAGAEASVLADTDASTEAGVESSMEASAEASEGATQQVSKEASEEVSEEFSENEGELSGEETSKSEVAKVNQEAEEANEDASDADEAIAGETVDKTTIRKSSRSKRHAKKHGKNQDITNLDVAVRAAESTTEAVASLSDIKDQKDGSLEELQAQTEHLSEALDAAEDATAALNDQVGLEQDQGENKQPELLVKRSIDEGLTAPIHSKHLPLLERVGASSAIKEAFHLEEKQHSHSEQQRQKRDQLLQAQQVRVQGQLAQEKVQDKEWEKEQDWFTQHLASKTKRHHKQHAV